MFKKSNIQCCTGIVENCSASSVVDFAYESNREQDGISGSLEEICSDCRAARLMLAQASESGLHKS